MCSSTNRLILTYKCKTMKITRMWRGRLCQNLPRRTLLIMRLSVLFLFSILIQVSAESLAQKLHIQKGQMTYKDLFKEVERQTGLITVYSSGHVNNNERVMIDVGKQNVSSLYQTLLGDKGLSYEVIEDYIVITKKTESANKAFQQKETLVVTGIVIDENGEPVPGVNIVVVNGGRGSITDVKGCYRVEVTEDAVLKFSFIGFKTQLVAVHGQTELNVVLESETQDLSEVVVTGYQTISKEQSTGAVTTLTAKDFEKKGQSNIINSLEGMIAGLSLTADPNNEGSKRYNIRGVSTLFGNSEPLIIVDGFPVETDISMLNPYEIESVTVLKDAAAASIYGARSANGVIVITTKRGKKGKSQIQYTNNFTFGQKPDLAYRLNRASSGELVDVQMIGAGSNPHTYQYYLDNSPGYAGYYSHARNLVYETMAQLNEGAISQQEADGKIASLRGIDNLSQLEDYFTENPFEQQHNLSLSGGTNTNNYRVSLNYTQSNGSFVGDDADRLTVDVIDNIKISNGVKADVGVNLTLSKRAQNPFDRDVLFNQVSSYELFKDADGNPLPVRIGRLGSGSANNAGLFGGKDQVEIQRLIDMGLLDENYYPLKELDNYSDDTKGMSARVQARIYAELFKGLKGMVGFQYESGASQRALIADGESFEMSQLINNTSPKDYMGVIESLNIPFGGRLTETRSDRNSYTLRGQLDFNRTFNKHTLGALAGSEIRHTFSSSTTVDKFGYDENTLLFYPVNAKELTDNLMDVNHPQGYIGGGIPMRDNFYEKTDRFFSVYGNFIYDYSRRYILTASMRIDQSNLFGTDPEYRYKPFWSVGGKWRVNEEGFFNSNFINVLNLRFSYGINGNIANRFGPFNIASSLISYRAGQVNSLAISSPSIPDLRWERTTTSNVGLDIAFNTRKVNLSIDYYLKKTDDILAIGKNDPTQGFSGLMKNDANIRNHGVELSLNTNNISTDHFNWGTGLTFRYNDNEVQSVLNQDDYVAFFVTSLQNVEGYPANSYFLYDWAGLDDKGQVTVYNKEGQVVTVDKGSYYGGTFSPGESLRMKDVDYAGTSEPKYNGALTNNVSYRNLGLSFMFVYSGGHVLLKDTYNGDYVGSQPQKVHKDAALAWKAPGDELTTDVPAVNTHNYAPSISRYSTKNIIDGDYIKLREVILTYSFPEKVLKQLFISRAILSFRANNLWYWAKNDEGIDPEAHGIAARYFPVKPSYTVGINVSF